jgi:hypothetical protein
VNDKETFSRTMMTLCSMYNRELDTVLLDGWWHACRDLTDEKFVTAVDICIEEQKSMPSPAVVLAISYRERQRRDERMAEESGIPGVPKLERGDIPASRREGLKYAARYYPIDGLDAPLFACLSCKDRRFVRADIDCGQPHFGSAIPCPRCNADAYDSYTAKYGAPPGMPVWSDHASHAAD